MSGKYLVLGILAMIGNIKLVDISDRLFSYLLPIFAKKPPIAIFEWKTDERNQSIFARGGASISH